MIEITNEQKEQMASFWGSMITNETQEFVVKEKYDELQQEIERLNNIIEIKNNRIQQLMKRTRSARIDKAIEYIDSREWENCEECMNIVYDILKGDEEE